MIIGEQTRVAILLYDFSYFHDNQIQIVAIHTFFKGNLAQGLVLKHPLSLDLS